MSRPEQRPASTTDARHRLEDKLRGSQIRVTQPTALAIKHPDGRDLLVFHLDGTVTGDVEDAPEAAAVMVREVKRLLGRPDAPQPRDEHVVCGQAVSAVFHDPLAPGTLVLAWPITRSGSPRVTRTRGEVWSLGDGTRVVAVEGHAGGIALTHIDVLPTADRLATDTATPERRDMAWDNVPAAPAAEAWAPTGCRCPCHTPGWPPVVHVAACCVVSPPTPPAAPEGVETVETLAEVLYKAHGWSGCAGSAWANLPQGARDGWEFAAREGVETVEAHAFRAEVLANPGTRRERWTAAIMGEDRDTIAEAREDAAHLHAEGYHPDQVRVAAITSAPVEPETSELEGGGSDD